MLGAAEIRAGDAELVIAGGMENMNAAPYLLDRARFGYRLGDATIRDATVLDGLWCSIDDCHMGTHAERVAIKEHVSAPTRTPSRSQPPEARSRPWTQADSRPSSRPVTTTDAKGRADHDHRGREPAPRHEPRRPRQAPPGLRAARAPRSRHAAPHGRRDADRDRHRRQRPRHHRRRRGHGPRQRAHRRAPRPKPLARIVGYAQAEVEPRWLFLAPVEGVRQLLNKVELPIEAFDLIEINEAFAAQVLADGRQLGLRLGQGQRERRRDRARPPDRRQRRPRRRDAPPRAQPARRPLRPRDPLPRRRRLGRDGLRARPGSRSVTTTEAQGREPTADAGRRRRRPSACSSPASGSRRAPARPSRAATPPTAATSIGRFAKGTAADAGMAVRAAEMALPGGSRPRPRSAARSSTASPS